MTKHLAVIALAAAALAACEQNRGVTDPAAAAVETSLQARHAEELGDGRDGARAVYTLTNQVAGNSVAVFTRAADGTLSAAGRVATGGTGTGAGLGSQGAVAVSDDGRWLLAVNAGSNDVSVFAVRPSGLSSQRAVRIGSLGVGVVLPARQKGRSAHRERCRAHAPGRALLAGRDGRRAVHLHGQRPRRLDFGLHYRTQWLDPPARCRRGDRRGRSRHDRPGPERERPVPVQPGGRQRLRLPL